MTPVEATETAIAVITALGGLGGLVKFWTWRAGVKKAAIGDAARNLVNAGRNDIEQRHAEREFIDVLQKENASWRKKIAAQDEVIESLQAELAEVRATLAAEILTRELSERRAAGETAAREERAAGLHMTPGQVAANDAAERDIAQAGQDAADRTPGT